MPFNGSGGWSWPYNWENDAAAGININAARMDGQFNDAGVNGFQNCLTRDGQGFATQNLPMGGFIHTGVGNGSAATHYLALGQFQSGAVVFIPATGTSDAITLSILPAIAALTDGMEFRFRASAANTTTTPTLQVSSTTARTITKFGGSALAVGDIAANMACTVRYRLSNTTWELITVSTAAFGTAASANTGTSGHTLGFLDGNLTFSGTNIFSAATTFAGITCTTLAATGNTTFSKQVNGVCAALTDAATVAWDVSTAQTATLTIGGNRTLGAPTNQVNGGTYVLRVTQDGTGSRTLAYNAVFKWVGGVAPVLSAGAGAVDILTFVSDGTNMYGVIQKAFS